MFSDATNTIVQSRLEEARAEAAAHRLTRGDRAKDRNTR